MSWGEGTLNWAELRDLVQALPEDSATKAAASGDLDGRRWTQDTYAAASTYNAILLMIRVLWAAHLKGQPPDMAVIEPPRLEADEEQARQEAAAEKRAMAILDRYSPTTAPADDGDIDHWQQKIRELEAAK
ncbi:hypothetical protein [Streptomyces sp. 4R-3d]|uniref:hypothetical protein n=1 Tax=Streptomyces sp. 4R-3d TaxID=2559605 RepID=UPI001072483A|nr:hypothetical protein [Streptomyces sp. 4R-3d]TFI30168.1 hypothetical protein E4P36_05310 [Streptomyces sp. 4R-3d]